MRWVILVPFTEVGYEKLYEYIIAHPTRYYLSIPFELCMRNKDLSQTFIPQSFLRVWGKILDLAREAQDNLEILCYKSIKSIESIVDFSTMLMSLVIKALAYDKIDVMEWIELFKGLSLKPPLDNWSGVLVVDRYVEYYALIKSGLKIDRIMQLMDSFMPTPMETLLIAINKKLHRKEDSESDSCDVLEVIKYVIKYIGDLIPRSDTLTSAYTRITRDKNYLDIVRRCVDELSLH